MSSNPPDTKLIFHICGKKIKNEKAAKKADILKSIAIL